MNNIVYLIIGLSAAIVILVSPLFGLGLTLILIPISTQLTMGGSFLGIFSMVTPIKIIGTLTFISALIHKSGQKGAWDFFRKTQIKYFFLFLTWIFISGFTQPGWASRENFTMFIANTILGITIILLLRDIKKLRSMLWLITISIFFICLQTILSYIGIERAGGTGYGPNEFAIAILPFIAITFYMAISEKNKLLKLISIGIMVIIFLALISTVSRGGIIGIAGMLLFALFKSKQKLITIIAIFIVVILFINFMPQNLRDRFSKTKVSEHALGTGDGDIDSTTRRYYLTQAGWRMFLEHPLFGIGIGNYYYENRNYAPVHPGRAHNMYIEIMAELGIIGIFLFLGTIFFTLKGLNGIIKSKSPLTGYAKGFYIGLVGFLIAGILLHAQQDRILWFIIFMSAALERIYEKNLI